jgi:leader peptidase (prepilin peptidase)/N-methyltransferase
MNFLLDAIVFLFGLTVGSFLNVCVFRMPRGESIVLPRSFCPRCRESIAWFDNVPLFSFLVLRGRCRRCCAPISPRYPLIELATGLLFVAVHFFVLSARLRLFRETGIVLPLSLIPFFWYFAASLLALSVIDWEHYILPDRLTYPLLAVGLGLAALVPDHFALFQWSHFGPWSLWPSLLHSLLGVLAGGLSLWAIGSLGKAALKKEAMGMGDVKLMAAVGAWLGWPMALLSIFLGALVAALFGVALIVARRAQWGSKIPFGPYLALGSLLCLFWGRQIIGWYLGWYVK